LINLESVLSAAFSSGGSISAVIIVDIAVSQTTLGVTVRKATAKLYPIDAKLTNYPLSNKGHLEKSPIEEQMVTHKKTAVSCRACNKYSYG
jgi:hypothetical protein